MKGSVHGLPVIANLEGNQVINRATKFLRYRKPSLDREKLNNHQTC